MPATATIPLISGRPLPRYADVLRSEFCKLRSVRSTFWALAAAVMFNVVVAALLAILLPGHLSAHEKATLDSVRVSLGGLHLSQIAIGLLGTLAITSEYSTGMIRASLAAVPQRRVMLTAKMAVFTASVLVTGIIASFAAYLVFQALLPSARGAAARLLAGHHRPLPPDERRRHHLQRPAPGTYPAALARVRCVLPLRGGRPGGRIRPDQPPRRLAAHVPLPGGNCGTPARQCGTGQ